MLLWSTFRIHLIGQTWTSLTNFFLLRQPIERVNSKFAHENKKDQTDLYDLISKQAQFRCWVVDRAPQILRGNYNISKILEVIEIQFNLVFSNKTIYLKIDFYQYRVEINSYKQFSIACYANRSILHQLVSDNKRLYRKLQENKLLNLW